MNTKHYVLTSEDNKVLAIVKDKNISAIVQAIKEYEQSKEVQFFLTDDEENTVIAELEYEDYIETQRYYLIDTAVY